MILLYINCSAFCIVDQEKTCTAVTLYNLAKGKGVTVGDSVAIPEPFLSHHQFSYENDVIFYFILNNIIAIFLNFYNNVYLFSEFRFENNTSGDANCFSCQWEKVGTRSTSKCQNVNL